MTLAQHLIELFCVWEAVSAVLERLSYFVRGCWPTILRHLSERKADHLIESIRGLGVNTFDRWHTIDAKTHGVHVGIARPTTVNTTSFGIHPPTFRLPATAR